MRRFLYTIISILFISIFFTEQSIAATKFKRIAAPPLTEQWFSIYVDNERVGFYRQKLSEAPSGYHIEADGSVTMKIMGFSKEATTRESYMVSKSLGLKSFEVEQSVNGKKSRVIGTAGDRVILLSTITNGEKKERQIKIKGEVFPGAAINILPLMRDTTIGKSYKVMIFDPEELKVKEVKISLLAEETGADGSPILKLRNNLYPFVTNDVLVNAKGETITESVRDGLVTTVREQPYQLGGYISNLAFSKKDLIYDFSMIRVPQPLSEEQKKNGLILEITGWNDKLPLMQGNFQQLSIKEPGILGVSTGTDFVQKGSTSKTEDMTPFLQKSEKIEVRDPILAAKAEEISAGKSDVKEKIAALASWTAQWLNDTVDDGGSALESIKSRKGNCQTHARLFTALARTAGIPTKFVSGLVYQESLGFLYHSWAESMIDGIWYPIDPTFNQTPADATHIKLFEGEKQEDLTPIISIIGRIKINILSEPPKTVTPVNSQKPPA